MNILKARYHNTPTKQLAVEFGRSEESVYCAAFVHGLRKDKAFIAETARTNSLMPEHGGRKGWYKKGIVPHNKGKQLSDYLTPEQIEKMKSTQFKKGQKPHNARADGDLSWRNGYCWIRISESNWKLLQRHVWETEKGAIPAEHNIIFLDGDRKNCRIENLACVSNTELLDKNRLWQYPPELQRAIRLNNKLIKEIERKKQ